MLKYVNKLILIALLTLGISSCMTEKRWLKIGKDNNWINTDTVKTASIDTVSRDAEYIKELQHRVDSLLQSHVNDLLEEVDTIMQADTSQCMCGEQLDSLLKSKEAKIIKAIKKAGGKIKDTARQSVDTASYVPVYGEFASPSGKVKIKIRTVGKQINIEWTEVPCDIKTGHTNLAVIIFVISALCIGLVFGFISGKLWP